MIGSTGIKFSLSLCFDVACVNQPQFAHAHVISMHSLLVLLRHQSPPVKLVSSLDGHV